MNISPADKLRQSLTSAVEAMNEMQLLGADASSLSDLALAVYHAEAAYRELPDRIANAETRMCVGCEHLATAVQSLPYGDRTVPLEQHECVATSAKTCRMVKACGFFQDDFEIPAFLRRQAS